MSEQFRCNYLNVIRRGVGGDIREFTASMVRHPNPGTPADVQEYTLHGVTAGDSFVLPDGCCDAEYAAVNILYDADQYFDADRSGIIG